MILWSSLCGAKFSVAVVPITSLVFIWTEEKYIQYTIFTSKCNVNYCLYSCFTIANKNGFQCLPTYHCPISAYFKSGFQTVSTAIVTTVYQNITIKYKLQDTMIINLTDKMMPRKINLIYNMTNAECLDFPVQWRNRIILW